MNWTDSRIWQSPPTAEYMRNLDLGEGQSLLERFNEEENLMHTQTVSCRKFFVRKKVYDFLERLQREGRSGQVVILAFAFRKAWHCGGIPLRNSGGAFVVSFAARPLPISLCGSLPFYFPPGSSSFLRIAFSGGS